VIEDPLDDLPPCPSFNSITKVIWPRRWKFVA